MTLRDYDLEFKTYLDGWLRKNKEKYKTAEAMENQIPALYEGWRAEAAKELEKLSNNELVALLAAYQDAGKGIPDVVYTEISSRPEADAAVNALRKASGSEELRITLVNLLSDMGSELPREEYVNELLQATKEDPYCNALGDALLFMPGISAYAPKIKQAKSVFAKELLLNAMVGEGLPELAPYLEELFLETPHKELAAALISKLGAESLLPFMLQAQYRPDVNYAAYLEICNAIEALGGETAREREFPNDPLYQRLCEGDNK